MAVLTKAQQVQQALRAAIMQREWTPGKALPPERELLESFGVSRTTLRHAISALATEGLLVTKPGSGTYVAQNDAEKFVAIATTTYALSSSQSFHHEHFLAECRRRITAAGFKCNVAVGYGNTIESVLDSMPILAEPHIRSLAGVISTTELWHTQDLLESYGIPSVSMSGIVPGGKHSVVGDYEQMCRTAAEQLKLHGHDDFAFMIPDHSNIPDAPWLFVETHEETRRIQLETVDGDESRLIRVPWMLNHENAYDVFKEWWKRPNRPSAIFFYDDVLCDVALNAIRELRIEVPRELAIISLGNVGRKFRFPKPITRLDADPAEFAERACEMLFGLMEGKPDLDPVCMVKFRLNPGETL